MNRARLLGLVLCVSAGCTSFHDALLSYAEDDAGEEQAADAGPEAVDPLLDAESAAQDAAVIPVEAASEGLDAALEPAPEAGLVDSSLPDAAKSCCQQWEDFLDGGLLDPPFDPLLGCVEALCKPLPMLPSHP